MESCHFLVESQPSWGRSFVQLLQWGLVWVCQRSVAGAPSWAVIPLWTFSSSSALGSAVQSFKSFSEKSSWGGPDTCSSPGCPCWHCQLSLSSGAGHVFHGNLAERLEMFVEQGRCGGMQHVEQESRCLWFLPHVPLFGAGGHPGLTGATKQPLTVAEQCPPS